MRTIKFRGKRVSDGNIRVLDRKKQLLRYSKDDLAERVAILEHNNKALKESFEIQYQNCLNIIDDMSLLNNEFKKSRTINPNNK